MLKNINQHNDRRAVHRRKPSYFKDDEKQTIYSISVMAEASGIAKTRCLQGEKNIQVLITREQTDSQKCAAADDNATVICIKVLTVSDINNLL